MTPPLPALHLPDSIPSLAEWMQMEPQKGTLEMAIAADEDRMRTTKSPVTPHSRFLLACAREEDEKAAAIMREQNWVGTSIHDKQYSLAFTACHANSRQLWFEFMALLFLEKHDPASLLSTPPRGGSMLHATLHGTPNPSLVKELLAHGVNPYRRNDEGQTYLERFRLDMPYHFTGHKIPEHPSKNQKALLDDMDRIVSMVTDFMAHHSPQECEAREMEIKNAANIKTWTARRTAGDSLPPL